MMRRPVISTFIALGLLAGGSVTAEAALRPRQAVGAPAATSASSHHSARASARRHRHPRPTPTTPGATTAPTTSTTVTVPSTTTATTTTTTVPVPSTTTTTLPDPGPTTSSPAPVIDLNATLPPGSMLPSSAQCAAAVHRSTWEPRPENAVPNSTTPPADWVQAPFSGFAQQAQTQIVPRVKGDFTGSTDEILQWAACKWGFDVDTVRAQAVVESSWRMSANGDGGASFGIMQIKVSAHPGTWPWARDSTAYNLDYTLARRRACYEGWTYDGPGSRGDLWGCIGMWYSGSYGSGYDRYVADVQREYAAKRWLHW